MTEDGSRLVGHLETVCPRCGEIIFLAVRVATFPDSEEAAVALACGWPTDTSTSNHVCKEPA